MSKKDEDELSKILKALKRFVAKRKGHALGVITYPPTEEEAKGVYVFAGDWVHWLIKGNITITLELIRHKFAKILKRLKERDEAIARDMEKREETEEKLREEMREEMSKPENQNLSSEEQKKKANKLRKKYGLSPLK